MIIVNFIRRVAKAFSSRSHHLIKMPTTSEMEESAREIEARFQMKDMALGVDGTPVFLKRKPREDECPPGTIPQDFWSR